uniref:Leucine-rich repeat-containing protein 14 n=1 Tax=Heterorhabditis bacteriophora TaxID=37862 RepID=A0A1I7WPW2_HETBA
MQQNDLPTSLSRKWSFLLNCIEQISQLTTVELGSNRLTWLKEFTKQHTLHIPPDAQKDFFGVDVVGCPGSTHECVCLGLSYIIHCSSPVTIFHKKFFLRCLAMNELHELSRRSMLLLLHQLPTVTRVPFVSVTDFHPIMISKHQSSAFVVSRALSIADIKTKTCKYCGTQHLPRVQRELTCMLQHRFPLVGTRRKYSVEYVVFGG